MLRRRQRLYPRFNLTRRIHQLLSLELSWKDREMVGPSTAGDDREKPPPLKRRKIRRGTQSCWECKRRKTRCSFATPEDSVCDGCRSRKVDCISQEFDEGQAATSKEMRGPGRTEKVVEGLCTLNGKNLANLLPRSGDNARQKTVVSPTWYQSLVASTF